MSEIDFKDKVNELLEKVRPALESHGGGAELMSYENGVVTLKVLGACNGCPMSAFTFQLGIEKILREKYTEYVKEVRYVAG